MFYYPNVLQRHTGCFSTIWLAATRGSRLVKREYLKVNVVKTCEEILDYVLVRVQPPLPGLPRPRFSLYLSAQLQIGVIRVYFQQCQYLVEDIQHILERLHRAHMQIRIDMVDAELPSLLLPNCLDMMETLEAAPDPFFGSMSVEPSLPSPFHIPQIRHLLESKTPERVPEEIPPEEPAKRRKPEKTLATVVSPESITLKEVEPIRILQIEGEQDLPEVSRQDLELLIAEEDEAILLEEQRQGGCRQQPGAHPLFTEPKEVARAVEGDTAVPSLSPPVPMQVEGLEELLPGPALGPEEPKPTGWEPGALPGEVTPPQELRLPAAPSPKRKAPSPAGPPARRRRRQLLFWDQETQISREKFQEQLQTRAHCWECPKVQPLKRMTRSPAELFRTPTLSGWLPPEVLSLWAHCARAPPGMERPPAEVAEAESRKVETPSEIEVLREALEPSGPLMLSSELSLEAEEERSRTSLAPPEERWGWTEVEQPEPPALPVVPELPVLMELPSELPPEPELLTLEAVHRAVALGLQANRKLDFGSLVPPLSPRKMAARVFYLLLVLCTQKIILVEQEEPYGHILIQPGSKFYQG
ncbi:LOW QUALITY PROTEIN: meiotic recombination protein REC8 homolog [Perognathus longimembris pacificus]|uniref:LOW QUALITY PROTEIN: meiotic recombination protein REC8 homolog n=1 Tax=Perognathus longimembris pacificus TaxID=214514 RepID=UPI0020196EA9|nr:LOW QUALITY PROTEIN: meiotic recombination protein REC8 homolog [Perognathus longimembris pacificus]